MAPLRVASAASFRDSLGERWTIAGPDGRTHELLRIASDLASVASFEFALRERVARMAEFEHPSFLPVHGVERTTDDQPTLGVLTDDADGVRLSDLLVGAVQHGLHFDLSAGLAVLHQVVPAMAALHEALPDVAHGALGPERLVVTRQGRVLITDCVLGSAVEQLRYSQRKYWRELRIAVPRPSGLPKLDQRCDATQLGIVALSLILGRPLREDEYPTRVGEVVSAAWAVSPRGGFEPLPAGLRGWLGRALQLDARTSFANAVDALAELERVLPERSSDMSRASFDAFLASVHSSSLGRRETPPGGTPKRFSGKPALPHHPKVVSGLTAARRESASPREGIDAFGREAGAAAPAVARPASPPSQLLVSSPSSLDLFDSEVSLDVAGSAAIALAVRPDPQPVAAPEVMPEPARLERLDAIPKPVAAKAPLSRPAQGRPGRAAATLAADQLPQPIVVRSGDASISNVHASIIKLAPAGRDRRQPQDRRGTRWPVVTPRSGSAAWHALRVVGVGLALGVVVAGSMAAGRHLGAPRAAAVPTTGTVQVQSNPAGARVVVDGQAHGDTPLTLTLSPGAHSVELSAQGLTRTIAIDVAVGKETSHYVELPAAPVDATPPPSAGQSAPGAQSGRLSITSDPTGLPVTVDGTPRGTTPTTVVDLAPGAHVVAANGPAGEIRRVVAVEGGDAQSVALSAVASAAGEGADTATATREPGWLLVAAPIELRVREAGRDLGQSGSDRIALGSGRHTLDLVNEALGYSVRRVVDVRPGKLSTIRLAVPTGSLAVEATPWAEVSIDGHPVGRTPLSSVSVAIGRHEVTLKHPELGERREQVVVNADAPTRVSIDLEQP